MENCDLKNRRRGKCSCGCDEFYLPVKDLTNKGWCFYCNHPPMEHELLEQENQSGNALLTLATRAQEDSPSCIPSPLRETQEINKLTNDTEEGSTILAKPSCQNGQKPIKYFPLPEFSKVLCPLLEGKTMTEKDHSKLSSRMKEEIITFLNRESLIMSESSGILRWQYRDLGETLLHKYPNMLWDFPSKRQKKLPKEDSAPYALFIRRLSQRRKMQRLRTKKIVHDLIVEIEEENLGVFSEDAISERKSSETAAKDANEDNLDEPTVTIKEEPADDYPIPSTSKDTINEEFILPHANTWTTPNSSLASQCTSLDVPNEPATPGCEQLKKKLGCETHTSEITVVSVLKNIDATKQTLSITEPIVKIEEEPVDYNPNPSTSKDTSQEEFILPDEDNSWSSLDLVAQQQITSPVASLGPQNRTDTSDRERYYSKKRKTNSDIIYGASTQVPTTTLQSPQSNFEDISNPNKLTKDQFELFGDFVANKLRNLDLGSSIVAQKEIENIILEAESGKYRSPPQHEISTGYVGI